MPNPSAADEGHVTRSPREMMWQGVRRVFPFSLIAGPFGLVYGATAADSGIANVPAIAASAIIQAGASQIALVELIADDASWVVAVATALVINLRFGLYSASIAPAFGAFPARWRFPLAHLLTDQTAVTSVIEYETVTDPVERRWFTLGAGLWFVTPWYIGTVAGVLLGGDIPDNWQIGFAVPLTFTALLVPTVNDRPKLAASIVGAAVAVATMGLPDGVNIMLGGLSGIVAGTLLAERTDLPEPTPSEPTPSEADGDSA